MCSQPGFFAIHAADLADEARAAAISAGYADALAIIIRDTPADLHGHLAPPGGLWLAHAGTAVVGCIALRPLRDQIGEIKRLYVRPTHRSQGLADALLDALEAGARERGFRELYLDTHVGLAAALRFYERRTARLAPHTLQRQPASDSVHAASALIAPRTGRKADHYVSRLSCCIVCSVVTAR